MKNNKKLITVLNKILVDELKTMNRDILLSGVNKTDNGEVYEQIYNEIENEAFEELKKAEWFIKRIIFLEVWRTHKSSIKVNPNIINEIFENRSQAV